MIIICRFGKGQRERERERKRERERERGGRMTMPFGSGGKQEMGEGIALL
jgi:hypothetical protein